MNPRALFGICLALAASGVACAGPAGPACDTPEHHQLDFWLGDWDVRNDGASVATSRIERLAGGCIVSEHYVQPDGYEGRSFSFFDARLAAWRQTWVDNQGGVGEFRGAAQPGMLRFEGETHRRDGTLVARRMTLSSVPGERVRQHSLASKDGGQTWLAHYDFLYVRPAP